MIRATQAGTNPLAAPAGGASSVAPGVAGAAAGVEATLFGAAGTSGSPSPVADEVMRFAQALAAVRTGQLAMAPAVSGEQSPSTGLAAAQVAGQVPTIIAPEHGLFAAPSWLRPRIEVAATDDAATGIKTGDVRVSSQRRTPASPALAEFGAPPWLRLPIAPPAPPAPVPQSMPGAVGRASTNGGAAAPEPTVMPVSSTAPDGPATAALSLQPELQDIRGEAAPAPTASGRGVAPRRPASAPLPARDAEPGTNLPVAPELPVMPANASMPSTPAAPAMASMPAKAATVPDPAQGDVAGLPDAVADVATGINLPGGRSRTPFQVNIPAHARTASDPFDARDTGSKEAPGEAPNGTVQPGSLATAAATPSGTEIRAGGPRDSDPSTPANSPGTQAISEDSGSPGGPVAADSSSASRPHVDPTIAVPFGPAAPDRATPVEVRSIPVDVAAAQWPKAIAAELILLGHQKVESATLRLSPEHLGHIEVQIHLDAKVINLTFGASHAETRTALEQALPQLRDGFAQAGLTLGEATVQQQMRQESQNDTVARKAESGAPDEVIAKSERRQALSLVDEYA